MRLVFKDFDFWLSWTFSQWCVHCLTVSECWDMNLISLSVYEYLLCSQPQYLSSLCSFCRVLKFINVDQGAFELIDKPPAPSSYFCSVCAGMCFLYIFKLDMNDRQAMCARPHTHHSKHGTKRLVYCIHLRIFSSWSIMSWWDEVTFVLCP